MVLLVVSIAQGSLVAAQTCEPVYQLQTPSGALYALVGVTGQFNNGSFVTVTGLFNPLNFSGYSQRLPNLKGVIYVLTLQVGTTTFSYYNVTVVQVSGTYTERVTQPSSYPPGLQTITGSGLLIYEYGCPQPATQTGNLALSSATELIPIAVVVILVLILVFYVLRHRKRS